MKKIILICIIAVLAFNVNAQTGPGGIGNADGTSGQPKNVLWLIADSLSYSDGNDIATWSDVSGNNNDLTQSNSSFTPIYRTNGVPATINAKPFAEFSKADNRIVINPFSDMPTSGITTFIIYKTSDSGDGLVSYNTASRDNAFLLFDNNSLTTYLNGGNNNSTDAFNSGSWQIMSHKWKSSGGDLIINHNGDQVHTATFQNGVSIPTGGCLAIGGEQDAVDGGYAVGQAFQGDIAEIIMYNSFLNSAQRIIVENYLSEKYALAFATAGNDKYTGNRAAFVHQLAGIGQEADGDHTQTNSGGLYLYERNTTLANGEYVMLGHMNGTNDAASIRTDSKITTCGADASWAREWYVDKSGTVEVKLIFDFKEALADGEYPENVTNYTLLYRADTTNNYSEVTVAAQGIVDADQMYFDVADANLLDGYYTIGTNDQANSPIEGTAGRTWYALASGNWDTWDYWTLDPSGALPNNPTHETPTASDKVVIHTGKTITLSSNTKTTASISVEGILQLGTTTGHNFTEIRGNGRIRLASDNFPLGDATHFTSAGQGEGTVVWQGGSYNLSTAYTFYKMEVDLGNAANTLTLLADYTLNGDLVIETGILQINDNATTTNLNIEVQGDVTVEATGQILTGTGNARHQFDIYGNFTNNGIVKFTNRVAANYTAEATDGIVDANFLSDNSNQTILCDSVTNFYRIEIDKGTDMTYELAIEATATANFNLFGYANRAHNSTAQLDDGAAAAGDRNPNALGLYRGTVKIRSNIIINRLSNSGNYNISEAARLWVDGGTVYNNNGNSTVPYGTIEVSAGLLESTVTSGITTRDNGLIKISGGTINTNVIRTSVLGAGNVGGYIQSGGTVNIVNPGSSTTTYYHFSMTYPGNTFIMTGGTLHVYDANGTNTNQGGIFIASDPKNINVTGGTVIAEIAGTANAFKITSKAPFYNLILRNTNDATTDHILDAGTNINGSAAADLAAQPLVVLNDLTIEDNVMLKHNGEDISIGGDLSISRNAQEDGTNRGIHYAAGVINTLSFNGSGNTSFYIGYNTSEVISWEFFTHNLEINKLNTTDTVTISTDSEKDPLNVGSEWHNRIMRVIDTIWVRKGVVNQGRQSVRLFGEIFVYKNGQMGIYDVSIPTHNTAYFMFRDGDIVVNTEKGSVFGNIKFNSTGTATFTSDIHIKRIGFYSGLYNIGTYNLKVDYLHRNATSNNFTVNNGNAGRMIYSDVNASDGGISLLITGNGTHSFPLGTRTTLTRYTPAQVTITNFSDDGYIQIRPVDGELKTTNLSGGDLLDYYWRVGYEGFTTNPTVQYMFEYDNSDIVGAENGYYPGKVLDESPYTRSYENDLTKVDDANNTITFNDAGSGFALEKANYTAGVANRFTGTINTYYTNSDYGNWNDGSIWHQGSKGGTTGTVPEAGSIAIIYRDDDTDRGRVWGQTLVNEPAEIKFEHNYVVYPTPDGENVPRLQFNANGTFPVGRVSGTGMLSFNANNVITLTGDIGDFGNNNESYILYFGGGDNTITNIPTPIPNLYLEAGTKRIGEDITVNNDFILNGWCTIYLENDIDIKRDMVVGMWAAGDITFPAAGPAVTVTVGRNIDFTQENNSNDRDLNVENGGDGSIEHKLILKGDIIHSNQNGNDLDFYNGDNLTKVILELQGDSSNSYYRTSTSVPDFYRIIMNKGTNQDSSFTFSDDFTLSGATSGVSVSKALELQNGTLILDDTNIDIDLTTGDDDFEIPATACLEVKNGTVNVSGDDSGIALDGKLLISGGTVDMDDIVGNGNNYIEYSASGNAIIEITSGALTVGSQIRRGLNSTAGVLNYTQSGGAVIIGKNAAPEGNRGVFEILNTGSSFTHSAGSLSLVSQQTNPTFASLYLDPETSSLTAGTTIILGNASTPASQEFGIYSTINLQNLTLDNTSTNNPKAKMWTVPLSLNGELTIQSGTEFKANGLDLNLYGDFTNSGTFTANQNTTYFKGTANQEINGNTTFYNLTNQNTANLNLTAASSDITIDNIFINESGATINDNSNDIYVAGNIEMAGTHVFGGAGDGITLNGTSQQVLTGSGIFGKLTISNANGIAVPVGNEIVINNYLKLQSGVFDIGGNLLTLNTNCIIQEANPFGENNMIQINASFTDNGVKKTFPSGALGFTYPIGSGGKYTPVEITTTTNTATGAYLIAKAANEIHPSIVNDSEGTDPDIDDLLNVLQYYWVLTANGFTDLAATIEMEYDTNDVEVTAPYDVYDYITARLLNDGTGNWLKYDDVSKFDETNQKLIFDISAAEDIDITGDYTAGVDGSSFKGAIPDQVPLYASNGTSGLMDWHTASTWRVDDGSGTWVLPATMGLPDIPRGARVRILVGDIVQTAANYISAYTAEINGTLGVGTTFGNRVGVVSGIGTLYTERGSLPAGFYETFFSATGGTIEFGGSTNYSVLSNISQVNNIIFSGTGDRELPNLELTILGDMLFSDLSASSPDVINEFDQNLLVGGDITFNAGTFDAGIGASEVSMNGNDAQTISGSSSYTAGNAFWNFELDNSNGLTINKAIDIDKNLTLTSGIITTTPTNILSITTIAGAVTVSSSLDYVDGPMRKYINNGTDFIFPVGDALRYGEIEIVSTGTASPEYWEAQYYDLNPHSFPMDTSSRETNLEMVSGNEYWRVEGPAGDSAKVKVRWDDQSLLPAMTSDRGANMKMVEWIGGGTSEWQVIDGTVTDVDVNSGTIISDWRVDLDEHYFTLGTTESAPLPAAGFITLDTSICAGTSADLRVQLGGSPDWTYYVHDGTSTTTHSAVGSSPDSFTVTPGATITYTIDSVADATGATTSATIFGSPVTVTVVSLPINTYNVTGGGSYCSGGSGVVVGLDGSETGVTYELLVDGASAGSTVAGSGGAVSFGNQTTAGNYTVDAAKDANTNCTETMTGDVDVTVNSLPTLSLTVNVVLDTICTGDNTQISIDFILGTGNFDFTISDGTNSETLNSGGSDPYSYTPATAPVWVDDGTPDTDYYYSITTITDANGCTNTNLGNEKVTVFKIPETGPEYHIDNTWDN